MPGGTGRQQDHSRKCGGVRGGGRREEEEVGDRENLKYSADSHNTTEHGQSAIGEQWRRDELFSHLSPRETLTAETNLPTERAQDQNFTSLIVLLIVNKYQIASFISVFLEYTHIKT